MEYHDSIKHIERLLDQRNVPSAMREMGTVLEQLLKDVYRECLSRLTAIDRVAISQAEQETAVKINNRAGRAETFTLGQIERFLRESGFLNKATAAGAGTRGLSRADLKPFVEARNDATHQATAPSENQARLHYHQLVSFLEEAGKLPTASALSGAAALKVWTDVVTPHEDIRTGQFEQATYAADLWAVAMGAARCPEVYRNPQSFFAATYMTGNLAGLLADVLRVLNGEPGDRVLQLRTPFGGGKSHALIALYHLAQSEPGTRESALEAIQERINRLGGNRRVLGDPGEISVCVLHGLELGVQTSRTVEPDLELHTLWGELAYQIGGRQSYELLRKDDEGRIAPSKGLLQQAIGSRPTLILLDEVLSYVEKANGVQVGASNYGRQVMIFLQTLTETVRALNQTAMVYSLQASQGEAFGAEGLLAELDHLVSRIDSKREPVNNEEVLKVVQRRLFANLGSADVRSAVAKAYAERYRANIEADDPAAAAALARRLEQRILDSYPLHPALLDLMYHRWGSLPSYQRTRGALQFLATAISAVYNEPGTAQALLGPGDVLLANDGTRNALFSQVGEREQFTSVLSADIIGGERAPEVDRRIGEASPVLRRLRVGTRVATAAFLYSFGARPGEDTGVSREELIAACLSPDIDRNMLMTTLHELQESLLYLHGGGGHFRFEPRPNLNKLIADLARQYEASEILSDVKRRLEGLIGRAPGTDARLWPDDSNAIPDQQPTFIIAYMGAEWADLGHDELEVKVRQWVELRGSTRRQYKNGLALAIPTSDRLNEARQLTRTLLAIETIIGAKGRHNLSDPQVDELKDRIRDLSSKLQASLRSLYKLVALPVESTGSQDPLAINPVDLQSQSFSSDKLQERILEALRHWVFDRVTPARLMSLTRLGQEETQRLDCGTLVSYCFSFLSFPKLRGVEPLRVAIMQGVQDGIFGYSAALQIDATGQPFVTDHRLVRIGVAMSSQDIDLSAASFLLAPDLARRLVQPPAVPELITPLPVTYPESATAPSSIKETPPPAVPGSGAMPNRESRTDGRLYRLRFRTNKQQLFRAFRPLQNLADKAGTLEVIVEIIARSDTPMDASWLRNAVEEPLDEADVAFEGGLEA